MSDCNWRAAKFIAIALLIAAAMSCGGCHENERRNTISELDSLRAMQTGSKVRTSDPYGEALPAGAIGRGMHGVTAAETIAIMAYAGEMLDIKVTTRGRCNISLFDVTQGSAVGHREVSSEITWQVPVTGDGIYALQISPDAQEGKPVSASYTITVSDQKRSDRPDVKINMVSAKKDDLMACAVNGLNISEVFKEPKRLALRGNLKAAFSGYTRAVVAVPVPSGADVLIYSLRVSNNENSVPADGKLNKRLTSSYSKVKVLGLPVFESTHGFDFGSLILDARPPREEDAFCNLFVFDNEKSARKFQNTTGDASTFDYNLDLSQIGTQSCSGELPCSGKTTVYLGFENERVRYDTYIWLEVSALKKKSEYLKPEFSLRNVSR